MTDKGRISIRQRWIVASAAVLLGGAVLVHGVLRYLPSKPATLSQPLTTELSDPAVQESPEARFRFVPDAVAEVELAPELALRTVEAARDIGLSSHLPQLEEAVEAYFVQFLGGEFEGYIEFVNANGGALARDESNEYKFRYIYELTAEAYKGQPVSLADVRVRRQGVRGASDGDFGGRKKFQWLPGGYPGLASVAEYPRDGPGPLIRGDTVEVILPIQHVYEDVETPVRIGVWFTWSPEESRWIPSKTAVYSPAGVVPIFAPPP